MRLKWSAIEKLQWLCLQQKEGQALLWTEDCLRGATPAADTWPLNSPELPQFWGSDICQMAKDSDEKPGWWLGAAMGKSEERCFLTHCKDLSVRWENPSEMSMDGGAAGPWGQGAGAASGTLWRDMSAGKERSVLAAGEMAMGAVSESCHRSHQSHQPRGKSWETWPGPAAPPCFWGMEREAGGKKGGREEGMRRWKPSPWAGWGVGGKGGSSWGGVEKKRQRGDVVKQFLTVRGSWDPDLSS